MSMVPSAPVVELRDASSSDDELAAALEEQLEDEESSFLLARRLQAEEDALLAAELAPAPLRRCSFSFFGRLPAELVARVLTFVPHQSLTSLQRASKALALLASAEARGRTARRLREALHSGFLSDAAPPAGAAGPSAARAAATPPTDQLAAVAAAIEIALHGVGVRKRSKCRQLLFNLADPNNPRLRARLVAGEIDAEALVRFSAKEMASIELQSQRRVWKRNALQRVVKPDWRVYGFVCDLYRCGSCDGYQTKLHRTIRAGKRAVDEVSTLYATCIACSARWAVDQA